jgi:cell division protein FtsL
MTPAKSIVVMLLATSLMLVVVWQKSERRRMSYRLDAIQREIAEHNARQNDLHAQIARLKSPERIRALVQRYGLDLHRPEPQPLPTPAPPAETPDASAPEPTDGT